MPTLLVCLSKSQLPDLDAVRRVANGHDAVRAETVSDICAVFDDAEIVLGFIPPVLVSKAPRLR